MKEIKKTLGLAGSALAVLVVLYALHCGGGNVGGGKKDVGEGPCSGPENCTSQACVEVNGESYCTKECGSCPSGMYCDSTLFGALGISLCLKGSQNEPVQPEKPPHIPCSADSDCVSPLVCAQYQGVKDCTIICNTDKDCEAPKVGGFKFDFYSCQTEESQARKVCLPREECMINPIACIEMPEEDGGEGEIGNPEEDGGEGEIGPPGCKVNSCDGPCCEYEPCMSQCQMDCFEQYCQSSETMMECINCNNGCLDKCNVSATCRNCLADLTECADSNDCEYEPPSESACIGDNCCSEYKACF